LQQLAVTDQTFPGLFILQSLVLSQKPLDSGFDGGGQHLPGTVPQQIRQGIGCRRRQPWTLESDDVILLKGVFFPCARLMIPEEQSREYASSLPHAIHNFRA
jgi:hypothetical protein